jgi:hypothetical protein
MHAYQDHACSKHHLGMEEGQQRAMDFASFLTSALKRNGKAVSTFSKASPSGG